MTFAQPYLKKNHIAIAKAIAIMLVVIQHASGPVALHNYMCTIDVPVFFFCSGLFLKPAGDFKQLSSFWWKRVKGLYFKWLKWSIPFIFLHNLFFHLNIYNSLYGYDGTVSTLYTWKDILERLYLAFTSMSPNEELLGGLWFLKSLLIASVIVSSFVFLFKQTRTSKALFLLFLIISSVVCKYFDIKIPYIGPLDWFLPGTAIYFIGYLMQVRVDNACKLLANENMSASEAALSVGYTNISNFNRQFKQLTGCTPKEYKKRK